MGIAPQLMLASTTKLPIDLAAQTMTDMGLWAAEIKLDGIRVAVVVTPDRVRLFNRRQLEITHRYPDVVADLSGMDQVVILDGEIVVLGPNGQPDFSMAHRRDAQGSAKRAAQLANVMRAKFVAFDVLFVRGIDVQGQPYTKRRRWLEALQGAGVEVNPSSDDGKLMWLFAKAHNLEGLVLKRKSSPYRPGRSPDWVKVKNVRRISAIVYGHEPGQGHRAPTFGALQLALVDDDGQPVRVGSVGTGFTNADCVDIRRRLDAGEHLIVEVEFLEVSPSGQLRNPSFRGIRQDLELSDCGVDQLRRYCAASTRVESAPAMPWRANDYHVGCTGTPRNLSVPGHPARMLRRGPDL